MEDGKETALWVYGDNLREYLERGGAEGFLGFPTNKETPYTADVTQTKGVCQAFSGSSAKARIHNHPSLGSIATWGAIGSLYTDMGGANSWLGVPTKAEWEDNDEVTILAEFENGQIAYNKSTAETIAYTLKSHNGSTDENSSGRNAGSSSGSNNSDDIAGDADQIFQELYEFFEYFESPLGLNGRLPQLNPNLFISIQPNILLNRTTISSSIEPPYKVLVVTMWFINLKSPVIQ